ncbi:MAG TPA: hypothetical protein VD816_19175 [Ohtaekwangia sp.]|nr:hypothetical protein [Ohtaekwangia sp.]
MKEMKSFKRIGLVTITALFFLSLTPGVLLAQESEVKNALRLLHSEQTKKSLETITKASQTYPDDIKVLYTLGYIQAKTGDKKNAEISFQKIIDKDAKEGLGYAGKGILRMMDNNTAEAKQFFDKALDVSKSKDPAVLRAVGEGYLLNEKFTNEAVTILQQAKERNDDNPYTLVALGDALLQQNNGGGAVDNYERAARLDPANGLPNYKVALVFFRSKNTTVAEENLLKSTKADPNFAPSYKELGELYYTTKQADKAVTAQESYLKTTENPEKGKFNYAFYLFMAKQYPKAIAVFKELAAKPDVTPTTLRYYAYALVESGNLPEAKKVFDLYFSKSTDISASDYAYYGKMLQKQGLDSLAVSSFAKSYERDTSQVDMLETVAELYFKLRNYDSSIIAYEKLIPKRASKPRPGDYFNIGRAYYVKDNLMGADSAFQKVIELAPNMTVGYLWAGRTNAKIDSTWKEGRARPYFEKLIEKAQANPDKGKNDLIEAYSYMGTYYVQKEINLTTSESYWDKVLALDPNNENAKIAKKAIKEARDAERQQRQQQQGQR